jgi:hypothetical protein
MHGHGPFEDPMICRCGWRASSVSFPTYGFGLALVTGSSLYTRFRNLELQRSALEREWSAARLAALRMQLSPHTLFNLLHTIRGHIEWDPEVRAVDGGAARRSAAPTAERRRARLQPVSPMNCSSSDCIWSCSRSASRIA